MDGKLIPSPNQTVGPFLHIGMENSTVLAKAGAQGQRMVLSGSLRDADGAPVIDGVVEIWQADANGHYAHPEDAQAAAADPAFFGWGRCATDTGGRFRFETVKPGAVAGPDGQPQAPHILVAIFMRGLLRHLVTRIYFEDEVNGPDRVFASVPVDRRATLLAKAAPDGYEWHIILQGRDETVFFDL